MIVLTHIAAFFAGVVFGIVVVALCMASGEDRIDE